MTTNLIPRDGRDRKTWALKGGVSLDPSASGNTGPHTNDPDPYHRQYPRRPDPHAPTHESMKAKGWIVDKVVIDPDTGKKITTYKNPKQLPVASKDYRPVAEDMRHPSRKLILMQAGHSSDPVPVRDMRLAASDTFDADGSNAEQLQASRIRAELHDRHLRMAGINKESPAQEFQTGNKAGFHGEQFLWRHMPHNPSTQRAQERDPNILRDDPSGNVSTSAARPALDSRPPSKRADAFNRPGTANVTYSSGSANGIHGEHTRDETARSIHGERPDGDILRSTAGVHAVGAGGQEFDTSKQVYDQVQRLPELERNLMHGGAQGDKRPLDTHNGHVTEQVYTRVFQNRADKNTTLSEGSMPMHGAGHITNEGIQSTLQTRDVPQRDGRVGPVTIDGALPANSGTIINVEGLHNTINNRAARIGDTVYSGPVVQGSLAHQALTSLGTGITRTIQGFVRSGRGAQDDRRVNDTLTDRANFAQTGVEGEAPHGIHERLATSNGGKGNDNVEGMAPVTVHGPDAGGHGQIARDAHLRGQRSQQNNFVMRPNNAPVSKFVVQPHVAMMAVQ